MISVEDGKFVRASLETLNGEIQVHPSGGARVVGFDFLIVASENREFMESSIMKLSLEQLLDLGQIIEVATREAR